MKFKTSKAAKVEPISFGPKHHFFGYYDKSPWDKREKYVLAKETNFIDSLPSENDKASIGIVDLDNKCQFIEIAQTRAWNWQQGCMLQWMPPNYEKYIIYNDRHENKFVSIIHNTLTKKKKILPDPIYSIHPDGEYAITLNFSRLYHTRRSYGYSGVEDPYKYEYAPKKDGIFLLNLKTGKKKLIISLDRLYNYKKQSSMEGAKHWVNHLSFNPDGSRFSFFHRWELKDRSMYTRLFTSDVNGKNLYLLGDSGNYTHYGWRNSKKILCWGSLENKIMNLRKNKLLTNKISKLAFSIYLKLLPNLRRKISNSGYIYFKDKSKNASKIIEDEDGHCSFSPDGKWVLTDTYPDKDHYRKLILYNFKTRKKMVIGKFYSIPHKKYIKKKNLNDWDLSEMRCDLHPRWSRDGKKICFDSVHEGTRQMYKINLLDIIKDFI